VSYRFCDFSQLTERQYNRYLLRTLGVTSHQFRHIFAIEMLNRGLSIETIAKLLGHNKTDTTLIYSPLGGKELSGDELDMVG
jgi:site-specific recombinase XerD